MKVRHGPRIDYRYCKGCKGCYNECPSDVFGWDDEKGLPTLNYPEECYYCGTCEIECLEQAINLMLPIHVMVDTSIYPRMKLTG